VQSIGHAGSAVGRRLTLHVALRESPADESYATPVVLTVSHGRFSPSNDGLAGYLDNRFGSHVQRACNSVAVAEVDSDATGRSTFPRTTHPISAAQTANQSSRRSSWCCTLVARRPNLIMFSDQQSAASDARSPEIKGSSAAARDHD
jgi:hypothetical protein